MEKNDPRRKTLTASTNRKRAEKNATKGQQMHDRHERGEYRGAHSGDLADLDRRGDDEIERPRKDKRDHCVPERV